MTSSPSPSPVRPLYRVRNACHDDLPDLWRWRNDLRTRSMARTPAPVDWPDYARWFGDLARDPARLMLVAALDPDPAPIAYATFQPWENTGQITISLTVAPDWRGQGHGAPLVSHFTQIAMRRLQPASIIAHIRAENHASVRVFERAGYACVMTRGRIHRYGSPVSFSGPAS